MTKSISDFAGFHGAMDSNSAFKTSASSSVTERRADLSAFHLTRRAKKNQLYAELSLMMLLSQPAETEKNLRRRERDSNRKLSAGGVFG